MKRFGSMIVVAAIVVGACSAAPGTGQQPAGNNGGNGGPAPAATQPAPGGGISFTITFTFDDRATEGDFWHAGEFTTTGTISTAVMNALTETRGGIGETWPASGSQQFGDYFCHTEDECLDPCVGSFTSAWQAEPELARIEGSGSHVVLDAQLHSNPSATDDEFLTSADSCPPSTNNGVDTFPPMHITIDGLGSGIPTYSIEPYEFESYEGPQPGEVWKLAIKPA